MPHKMDTEAQVFFYPDEFYPLSNFSPFRLHWHGLDFDTSEHAYHWEKFNHRLVHGTSLIQALIVNTTSAHEAFHIAQRHTSWVHPEWERLRVGVMRAILIAKVHQHEYVRRKLLETGEREIIEDSWRDAYWGWGPEQTGENVLGKLWMAIREDLRDGRIEGLA